MSQPSDSEGQRTYLARPMQFCSAALTTTMAAFRAAFL
jgi:hypothetical protein